MTERVRTKSISEVFLEASRIRTKQGRIDYLRANESPIMCTLVVGAYHPEIVWLLPRGIPPFRPTNQRYDAENVMASKREQLAIFCLGDENDLTWAKVPRTKRQKLFIDVLETVHPDDAILLCHVKDKSINYPFMTSALFKEAFPAWFENTALTWETDLEKVERYKDEGEVLPNPLSVNLDGGSNAQG